MSMHKKKKFYIFFVFILFKLPNQDILLTGAMFIIFDDLLFHVVTLQHDWVNFY